MSPEEEELQRLEKRALRTIAQYDQSPNVALHQLEREAINLRIMEAQSLLGQLEGDMPFKVTIAVFRSDDALPVVDSDSLALCRHVLRRIITNDKEKLNQQSDLF